MTKTPHEEALEAQIKHMVERFLRWKLPENFNPDGGISFQRMFNEHTAHPMKHEPVGTNLLDYNQAKEMVLHMLEGLPVQAVQPVPVAWRCKDYADGWIIYQDESRARHYQNQTCCLMEALYAAPLPAQGGKADE